ncbi:pentatricopeptide repeat-containing protein At1g77360, mitochondrial-like [Benincasa hispida]|uniref:pentatricopeptide repeat-containing protein At1g77360, mitochondrial-like n=1 Tax=Benincasa hispida TaxID=102211 RepID=UPI0019003A68|nr:pentatricopeptide repeat-containing protein At1g77360, mitochondrial-like [Benincasa hispida]
MVEAMAENPKMGVKNPSKIPTSSSPASPKSPRFPLHLDLLDISPAAKTICEVLVRVSRNDVDAALSATGVAPSPELVQEVLRVSYNHPSSAIKFFRWARQLAKQSAYSWNLMIDLLGKNELFEEMWNGIRTMRQEKIISLPTFVSVFGSYCSAGRFKEAMMSFEVMDRYEVEKDVVAVNSLLSAICTEENQTSKAWEFFEKYKEKIPLDGDSFAILLEGWEKEGNVEKAEVAFGEMVKRIGWNPENVSSYDAFLTTLVRGGRSEEAIKVLLEMKKNGCLPGLKFLSNALDSLIQQNDANHAILLWDIVVGSGLVPNLIMYNAIIGLLSEKSKIKDSFRLFDAMVFHGAFPNSSTYNLIFSCLIKNKKVKEASQFFREMVKNECPPTPSNCAAAITMLFDGYDPETAIDIWNYMVENHIKPMDASANALLIGLCNLDRLTEVKSFAYDMLDRRIGILESTMKFLKNSFYQQRGGLRENYDSLLRRWRASSIL